MTDAYSEMVKQAHEGGHLWVVWSDGLVSNGRTRPTREQLIAGNMSIPETVCRRVDGRWVYEPTTYWTREQSTLAVDAILGRAK